MRMSSSKRKLQRFDARSVERPRYNHGDVSLPDINDRHMSLDKTSAVKGGKKLKGAGICLCFALKNPFMKCGYCRRLEKSTPRMNIDEQRNSTSRSPPKTGLIRIGGGGWKRISPEGSKK